jgi:hypothetical protein
VGKTWEALAYMSFDVCPVEYDRKGAIMRYSVAIVCLGAIALASWGQSGPASSPASASAPASRPSSLLQQDQNAAAIDKAKSYLLRMRRVTDGRWSSGRYVNVPLGTDSDEHIIATAAATLALEWSWPRQHSPGSPWLSSSKPQSAMAAALRFQALYAKCPDDKGAAQDAAALDKMLGRAVETARGRPLTADGFAEMFWLVQHLPISHSKAPSETVAAAMEHFARSQNADGGWGFAAGEASSAAATAMGMLAWRACDQYLSREKDDVIPRDLSKDPFERGMNWLDAHFADFAAGKLRGGQDLTACLYYLGQVSLASKRQNLGGRNLYEVGAKLLASSQNDDGSWPGQPPVLSTAFGVLFFPWPAGSSFISHLMYDGDWNNRPYAMAGLGSVLKEDVRQVWDFRVVDIKSPVDTWNLERVILLTGSQAPKFSDEDIARLRTFVLRGGMLLSCAEGGKAGEGFNKGMEEAYARMFPRYKLQQWSPVVKAFGRQSKAEPDKHTRMISNGVRALAIHCDSDLTLAWQRPNKAQEMALTRDILYPITYAAEYDHINRYHLPPWPDKARFEPSRTVTVAILAHGANPNPEPLAMARFARGVDRRGSVDVKIKLLDGLGFDKLAGSGAQLAILSGTGELNLDEAQQKAIVKFAESGGTVLVEAVGADEAFARSAKEALAKAFGDGTLRVMNRDDPFYGMWRARLAAYTLSAIEGKVSREKPGQLQVIRVKDRLAVIYSDVDITCGLLGMEFYGVVGYAPEAAEELMTKIVLHSAGS